MAYVPAVLSENRMIFKRAKYFLAFLFVLIWSACSHVSRHPLTQPQTLLLSSVLVPRAPLPLDALRPLHDYTADLRSEIERVVGAFGSEGMTWGIKIISLDRNEIIYERDSSKLL